MFVLSINSASRVRQQGLLKETVITPDYAKAYVTIPSNWANTWITRH